MKIVAEYRIFALPKGILGALGVFAVNAPFFQ